MQENTVLLSETLDALVQGKKYSTIRDILMTMNPADVAILFQDMPEEQIPILFRLLPKEQAADTFVEMDSDQQELLIKGFSDSELKEVVDELYVDDAADLVEEMPANVVKRILSQADPETRKMINEILKYPEDSAGSIMTTEYVSLRPNMTAEEAIKRIRRTGIDKETIYTCYVIASDRKLIGFLSLKHLLLAEEDDIVERIMDPNPISVTTADDQEEVVKLLSRYDFVAVPVVDKEGRLVGIVTVDDAMDVMETEATEDIEKMAAITPSARPYLKMSVFELWKSRIPWLLILMVSATFTGMIISSYENALAAQAALTAFIPMLMDTGGNSGSQSSVTIIRSLSLGDVKFADFFRIVWKELRVAFFCGGTLACVNFVKILLVDKMLLHSAVTIPVVLVVCMTLVVTVLFAKLIGCTLPLVAQKLGFDPAVMASPILTTIVDAVTLSVYFRFAIMLLHL